MISRWSVSLAEALRMIGAAQQRAEQTGLAVAVAVVDPGGVVVALQAMDGTQAAGADVAVAKARAAALFRRPTAAFEDVAAALGKPAVLLLPTAVPHALAVAGGLPVLVAGQPAVAGAIGVSGGSGEEDVDVARHGLAALELR